MVNTSIDQTSHQAELILKPNSSASWKQNLLLIKIIGAIALSISLGFMLAGAWMIFPFCGLELTALFTATYWISLKASQEQIIQFAPHQVSVTRRLRAKNQSQQYHRLWTKIQIYKSNRPNRIPKIFIRCQSQQQEIGEFLGYQDKLTLIRHLKEITLNNRLSLGIETILDRDGTIIP